MSGQTGQLLGQETGQEDGRTDTDTPFRGVRLIRIPLLPTPKQEVRAMGTCNPTLERQETVRLLRIDHARQETRSRAVPWKPRNDPIRDAAARNRSSASTTRAGHRRRPRGPASRESISGVTRARGTTDVNLLRISKVSETLGCSTKHVRGMIRAGSLPAIDISLPDSHRPCWRVPEHEVRRFLDMRLRKTATGGTREEPLGTMNNWNTRFR